MIAHIVIFLIVCMYTPNPTLIRLILTSTHWTAGVRPAEQDVVFGAVHKAGTLLSVAA